jgi:hypothetical protein
MKHTRDRVFRALVAILAVALLLFPSWLMATVFTSVNFVVAFGAIFASVLTAIWLPRWKWVSAVVASLLIAVPPYPFWLYTREDGNWYLNFFHGFTFSNLPFGTFGTVFVLSLLLFAAIFWAIGRRRGNKTRRGSLPDRP